MTPRSGRDARAVGECICCVPHPCLQALLAQWALSCQVGPGRNIVSELSLRMCSIDSLILGPKSPSFLAHHPTALTGTHTQPILSI